MTNLAKQHLYVEHLPPEHWYQRVRYRLLEPLYWGEHEISSGFISDGATIPRTLWIIFNPMGKHAKAAFVHDYLLAHVWQKGQGWMTRAECDRQFKEAMKALDVPAWRVNMMYGGVRLFAIITGRK